MTVQQTRSQDLSKRETGSPFGSDEVEGTEMYNSRETASVQSTAAVLTVCGPEAPRSRKISVPRI